MVKRADKEYFGLKMIVFGCVFFFAHSFSTFATMKNTLTYIELSSTTVSELFNLKSKNVVPVLFIAWPRRIKTQLKKG